MEYFDIALRSSITFLILLLLTRIMGRKQLSQITFFDYIVGITIGSIIAAIAVDRSINFMHGLISTGVWCLMKILVGYIGLKSIKLRVITEGKPLIVIKDGVLVNEVMKKERYNLGDLLMQLREKGVFNLSEVNYAILEPDGELSVLKKSQYNPVTPNDMNIQTNSNGLMVELVIDGRIITKHLNLINRDENWLISQLNSNGFDTLDKIVFAGLQSDGEMYVSVKNKIKGSNSIL